MGVDFAHYYGYHKYRWGDTYYEGIRRLKRINSLKGLDKYDDEITDKINKLRAVKDQNYPYIKKIYEVDCEIQSIQSQIDTIKRNPSNKVMFGLLLNEESKNRVEDLKKKQQSLYGTKSSLSSWLSLTESEYNSTIDEIRDLEKLQGAILNKAIKVEGAKIEKEELKATIAGYEGKSRNLAKLIKKQLNIYDHCPYCGNDISDDPHADHIYPLSKGGQSTRKNMVYICKSCNIKKKNLTLREFIKKYNMDRSFIEQTLEKLGKSF